MGIAAHVKKTKYYLRRNGLKATCCAVWERLEQRKDRSNAYAYVPPTEAELDAQRKDTELMQWLQSTKTSGEPFFSILVPLYRTPRVYLEELVESVMQQTCADLELILADATEDDSVEQMVRELTEASDRSKMTKLPDVQSRIVYQKLARNGGISENTNEALKLASGVYVGLLDHDDVLTPDALYEMARRIREEMIAGRKPLLLYSDEDKCNGDRSLYFEPHYKMDFNRELLLSNNYICHFLVLERRLFQKLGLRKTYDGAQDFDLVLRAVEQILPQEERIVHLPKVLYHWRCHTGSTAENPQSKQYAYEAGKRAVQDCADRMGWSASADHMRHLGYYRLRYQPSLLATREDVAAVGGALYRGGRLVAGAYDEQGKLLYRGLRKGFSGYMHRGVLVQNAAAVDIRQIAVKEEYRSLFTQVTGLAYVTVQEGDDKTERFDSSTLPQDCDPVALSLAFSEALRKIGQKICWDPEWSRRL